jgi:hypothetical protein
MFTRRPPPAATARYLRGLGDTDILIYLERLATDQLPAELLTSTARKPRGRIADLMIASIAAANRLPLFTTNPADFQGLESVVAVVPVPIPPTAS